MKKMRYSFLMLFVCFVSCAKVVDETDPNKVGEQLCDCYKKKMPKMGFIKGGEYCDSIMAEKSRLFKTYYYDYAGPSGMAFHRTISSSLRDSANIFAIKVSGYLLRNCDTIGNFFWRGSNSDDGKKREFGN